MTTAKTFKLEQETLERLQAISAGLGLTWDETFSTLSTLYEQNQAASEQGRTAETRQFQALLQKVADAYTAALELNGTAEERIRHEYAARVVTAEQSVVSLKEKANAAELAQDKAETHAIELEGKLKEMTDELNAVKREYMEYKSRAEKQAQLDATTLNDTKKLNGILQTQIANLTEQVEAMKEKTAAAEAVSTELAKVRAKEQQSAKALAEAKQEVAALQKQLADVQTAGKAREQELKGRYDERAENAQQAAENKLQAAILAEREQSNTRAQTRLDKMQAQLDKATARADEWQEKYYALKDSQG